MKLLLGLLLAAIVAGCGADKWTDPPAVPGGLPIDTPKADSPEHLLQRFEATWEAQSEVQYAYLLTADFRFGFSPTSDPDLVALYPSGWTRSQEIASITNLFDGFTPPGSPRVPGASKVELFIDHTVISEDPEHPEAPDRYKVVHATIYGTIESPDAWLPFRADQEFQLVRGDAAVLPDSMPSDSTYWFIRGWNDRAVSTALRGKATTSVSYSLGRIRSFYAIPPDGPDGTELLHAIEQAFETKNAPAYVSLLTEDFHYDFSAVTDPDLVDRYGSGWSKKDEAISIQNLFHGFTNAYGEQIPAADQIALTFYGVVSDTDYTVPSHADSAAWYRRVAIGTLDGMIVIPGAVDPITYSVSARHELYFVRGDAAVLGPGGDRRPIRWYLRRWMDLSTPSVAKFPQTHPAAPKTFGAIRGLYRF